MDHMSRAPTFRAPEGVYTCFDWSNPLQNKSAAQYGADPGMAVANPSEAMVHSRVALRSEVPRLSGTVIRSAGAVDGATGFLTVSEPIASQGIEADTQRLPPVGPATGPGSSSAGPTLRQVRPKQTLKNATNNLISRVQIYQDLSRAFSSLNKVDPLSITMFSAGKNVFWFTQLQNKIGDPALRLLLAQSPLCHDVNQYTRQPDRLDVAIGFNTGDILWVDPISQRYSRLNKDGCSTKSGVRQVAWLPGSETVLFTTHENGCVYIWDVERDDSSDSTEAPVPPSSWDARRSIIADRILGRVDTPSTISWRSGRSKDSTTSNPMRYWRVSRRALTDLKFSPNSKQVAIACDDGILRIIDVDSETWSPDGQYIVTGGQDDLISIFAPQQHRIVARGMGHHSFNDVYVSAAPRAEVPMINPLVTVPVHGTVLSDVRVASNHLVLLHVDGTLDVYMRPDPHSRPSLQFADVPTQQMSSLTSVQSENEGLPDSKSVRTGLSRLGLPRRWNANSNNS
ncbi:hypothetical protein MCAP1_000304 [Malassezia caprae]|uniref:Uncharacterized protein n=1 Tax=Malassezia caprae TaxID=1381934 RepID=A0AAF0E8J8_9BASI|nr:hypothetical protein MCAP1_000304 [Malassezia caprae]